MNDVQNFAQALLRALVGHDPSAVALKARARGRTSVLGVEDFGDWVPLLRLSNPSASCNVMDVDVRQGQGWAPGFTRGTPAQLAEQLAGPLAFTWQAEVGALEPVPGAPDGKRT